MTQVWVLLIFLWQGGTTTEIGAWQSEGECLINAIHVKDTIKVHGAVVCVEKAPLR